MSAQPVLRVFGRGFNYSQDGPGNRLIYHLSGCNMHCPWCSNPDGMSFTAGRERAVSELLSEALSCRAMFMGGGGVTLTGGEVSCQAEAAAVFLKALRENRVNTAVETNCSLADTPVLFPDTDYLIADFKHPCEGKLYDVTGASLPVIKQNLELRAKSGKHLSVRVPLIHGFNDSPEELALFTQYFAFLSSLKADIDFELLRYHEYGKEKWQKLGLTYAVEDGFVTDATFKSFSEAFGAAGLKVIRT